MFVGFPDICNGNRAYAAAGEQFPVTSVFKLRPKTGRRIILISENGDGDGDGNSHSCSN